MRLAEWESWVLEKTEKALTRRKRRRLRRKEKQKRKNQILDWIQALLWAAVVVLLVNQYLLQGYAVPTGSMEDTILGEDRLFVDKIVYGPEIIPGFGKLPGASPTRGEIVVFVNPKYEAEMGREVSGVEQLFHRLVYMITFTLVNLDMDKDGNPAHHFLVKRLIGMPGEQLRMRNGRIEIKRGAETAWTPEEKLNEEFRVQDYDVFKKFYPFENYDLIKRNVVMQTLMQSRIRPENIEAGVDRGYLNQFCKPYVPEGTNPAALSSSEIDILYKKIVLSVFEIEWEKLTTAQLTMAYQKILLGKFRQNLSLAGKSASEIDLEYKRLMLWYNFFPFAKIATLTDEEVNQEYDGAAVKYVYLGGLGSGSSTDPYSNLKTDPYFEDYWREYTRLPYAPQDMPAMSRYMHRELGWYVPADSFFPMGDNRDNSKDARYFGSVNMQSLLGRPLFRFWPLNRLGAVRAMK